MLVFWALTAATFFVWLFAATGVFQAPPWIHLLLVVSLAFAATGVLFRPSGQKKR